MKLKLFLVLCITLSVNAQDLSEILNALGASEKVKSLQEKSYSSIASNEMQNSYEAPELGLSVAHAKDSMESGAEYGITFSQTITQPFLSQTKQRRTEFLNNSIRQELKHAIHSLNLKTSSLYHNACVSQEIKEKATMLFNDQNKRFQQLQKAYNLGEISRKNILFNKLDLAKLKQKISTYKREYLVELSKLQESVDNLLIDDLYCGDLVEITREVKLTSIENHSEIKNISYLKDSSKAMYTLYNSMFQSIGYELGYDQELDADIFTFGVSIPLDSLTAKNEKQKAKYLYKTASLESKKDVMVKEILNKSKSLQLKIGTLYDEYTLLRTEILPLSDELLKLSASALREGESTAMEYLDASRSYSENTLEVLQIKKNYYNELFELYKVADIELGE